MDGDKGDDGSGCGGSLPAGMEATDNNLPKRLFATDRYPNARLNVYSKPKILSVVRKVLGNSPEYERLRSSPLGVLFDLPVSKCALSCKLIHALLSRQLVTEKKYELWTVFGGQPLRFSLAEFREITGLPCGPYPKAYDPAVEPKIDVKKDDVWQRIVGGDSRRTLADIIKLLKKNKNMPGDRKLALSLILIVDGVLIGKHQVNKPTPRYVRMLADVGTFLEFPWGRESFFKTIGTMKPGKKGTKNFPDPVEAFCQQLQQQTIAVKGFPLALQLMAFKAIPLLLKKVPTLNELRTFDDPGTARVAKLSTLTMSDLIEVENNSKLTVTPIHPISGNGGWGEWDDEVRDWSVLYLERLIADGQQFGKAMWPGGDASLDLVEFDDGEKDVEDDELTDCSGDEGSNDFVEVAPARKGNKKRVRAKAGGSGRKQRRLEDYFEPTVKAEELKQWVEEKMGEMSKKIERQAREIKQLKRKRKSAASISLGKKSSNWLSGSNKRKHRTSGPGAAAKKPSFCIGSTSTQGEVEGVNKPWTGSGGLFAEDGLTMKESSCTEVAANEEFPAACTQPCEVPEVYRPQVEAEVKEPGDEGHKEKTIVGRGEEGGKLDNGGPDGAGDAVEEGVDKDTGTNNGNADAGLMDVAGEVNKVGSDCNDGGVTEIAEMGEVLANVEDTILKAIAENIGGGCVVKEVAVSEAACKLVDDEVVVSDSSPVRDLQMTPTSKVELGLLKLFASKENKNKELLPCVDNAEFMFFDATLKNSLEREHICANNIVISSTFLVKLAKPTEWVSTTHMEVLMVMLKERHKDILKAEASCFASPWLVNHLQGKYRSFSKAKNRNLISWGDRIKTFVATPGEVWYDDIETVYVPMCWNDRHWVGLAIHLRAWAVEVFDPAPNLYKARKVKEFMEPVTEMLPYLIAKWCNPHESQAHGITPMGYHVVEGLYDNKRSGDCGPVAVKFMELHANGNPDDAMSSITDDMVDDFRKQYAMDVYEEMVVPLYTNLLQ